MENGSQFKVRAVLDNEVVALLRPRRTSREQQAMPNQIYFAEYERHTSEIAAYHLDRLVYCFQSTALFHFNFISFLQRFRFLSCISNYRPKCQYDCGNAAHI